jgi:hypothetical protein
MFTPYHTEMLWGPLNLYPRVPGSFFPGWGMKWEEHEADHPPPTNAEVKKTWIYIHSPYVFIA